MSSPLTTPLDPIDEYHNVHENQDEYKPELTQ